MKSIIVASSNPTKFMHDASGPPSNSLSLNAIPKLVLNKFARVGKAKDALLGDKGGCNVGPPFVNHNYLC